MTIAELKAANAIYVENIRQVFDYYAWELYTLNELQAYEVLMEEWKRENCKNAFADFYYFTLQPEERERVDSVLTRQEKAYLDSIRPEEGREAEEIIFPLTCMLLSMIVKLNACEMLFSTIYFTKKRSTWWGNYNQGYVVFTERKGA